MATNEKFDVWRILIDWISFSNIMYVKLLTKLGLKWERLSPYRCNDFQDFNELVTRILGFIELKLPLDNGEMSGLQIFNSF